MGRTSARKKRIEVEKEMERRGEKRKYKVQTNPRRLLFLLKFPINQLPTNQLPTIGNVLRYHAYLRSERYI